MFIDRGAAKPGAVAFLVSACISILACEDPVPPPTLEPPIDSAEAVIDALARAYRTRDSELYNSLLANEPSANADFLFLLSEPTELGEIQWGYDEETRIHRRMFHPESAEPPVESALRLQGLTVTLTQQAAFTEQPLLYSTNGGLDGKLDPERWRAMEARYSTNLFLDLDGIDYLVTGWTEFIVIEDRSKSIGDTQKFLLLRWEDSSCRRAKLDIHSECATWGLLKLLYR